jgi:hypothetical protein
VLNRWLLLGLVVLAAGCGTQDSAAYRSIWAELYPATLSPEPTAGTLQGSFFHAAAADTEAAADSGWTAFLTEWEPDENGFEDAMHARFVEWARLERERLRHLERNDSAGAREVEEKLRAIAAEYD